MTSRPDWLSQTLMAVLEQQPYPVSAGELASILELSESEAARGAERLVIEERVMAVRIDGLIHFTLPGRPIRPPPRRTPPSPSGWSVRGFEAEGERAPGRAPERSAADEIAALKRRLAEAEARAAVRTGAGSDIRAADLERRLEMALRENDELRVSSRALREELSRVRSEGQDVARALAPLVQDLLLLCHPDRHGSSERSTRITRFLLELRGGR
jgi:hypothetical protein